MVEYDLEPVPLGEANGYGPDQRWAVRVVEHAVELLRRVAADLGAARSRAAPLRERLLTRPSRRRGSRRCCSTRFRSSRRRRHRCRPRAAVREPTNCSSSVSTAGVWRSAFDNWAEMAERYQYPYELVTQEADEPYVRHLTKLQLLRDDFESLPRARLVFCLDAADAFVCAEPAAVLARDRSYGHSLVMSAEHRSPADAEGESSEQRWRFGNAGGYVGDAGVMADALRYGFDLEDWERYGRVCDQRAMVLYLDLPENRHRGRWTTGAFSCRTSRAAARYVRVRRAPCGAERSTRRHGDVERAFLRRQRARLQPLRPPLRPHAPRARADRSVPGARSNLGEQRPGAVGDAGQRDQLRALAPPERAAVATDEQRGVVRRAARRPRGRRARWCRRRPSATPRCPRPARRAPRRRG